MIVVDSSAILCLAYEEGEAGRVFGVLDISTRAEMSGASYLECCIALRRSLRGFTRADLDESLRRMRVTVVPIDHQQIAAAVEADARFGRGTGHPARLNFGDCLTYALVSIRRARLLFIGNDFIHTDIEPALR